MEFMSLPVVMIENIFSYLTYDEIAKNRILSKLLDDICKRMLNRGFLMIERRHAMALKSVKTQLPRRESERRYHPLSRHCDILTSIETRISMLNMTYSKFIDNGLCCFIPGRVIDEIRRVLSIVETSKTPPRAHEVLQELRDISSMAIEHFDDKVSPEFRRRLQEGACAQPQRQAAERILEKVVLNHDPKKAALTAIMFMVLEEAILAPVQLRSEMNQLQRRSLVNAKLSLFLASQYKKVFKRMVEYRRTAWKQRKTILNMSRKQKEHGNAIADLRRRIEECDVKYSELTHTNQAGGVKAIAATAGDSSAPAQPLRHFGSQIKLDLSVLPIGTSKRNPNKSLPNMKPRKPLIKLPSLSEDAEPLEKVPNTVDNPSPSTSIEKPTTRTKAESDIAKIRGVTNQLRHMSKNFDGDLKGFDGKSKNFDGKSKADGKLKRPSSLNQDAGNVKKHKLD